MLGCLSACWFQKRGSLIILGYPTGGSALNISSSTFRSGLFHFWIWTCPLMQTGVSVKNQKQNGKQCISWWDCMLQAVSTGSRLFAQVLVLVCQTERPGWKSFTQPHFFGIQHVQGLSMKVFRKKKKKKKSVRKPISYFFSWFFHFCPFLI